MEKLKETALALLMTDLGYMVGSVPQVVKDLIAGKLDAAAERIKEMGINLEADNAAHRDLWVGYAAYLYRHRDTDRPMPRSLRLAINDAKVAAATKGAET